MKKKVNYMFDLVKRIIQHDNKKLIFSSERYANGIYEVNNCSAITQLNCDGSKRLDSDSNQMGVTYNKNLYQRQFTQELFEDLE